MGVVSACFFYFLWLVSADTKATGRGAARSSVLVAQSPAIPGGLTVPAASAAAAAAAALVAVLPASAPFGGCVRIAARER